MLRHFLKEYFTFSKRERNGILVLLGMVLTIYIFKLLIPYMIPSQVSSFRAFEEEIDRAFLHMNEQRAHAHPVFENPSGKNVRPFAFTDFDPNTQTEAGWMEMGFSLRQARTIINFRDKGGQFYRKEDLKKIYGLSERDYERVAAYIRIEERPQAPAREYTQPVVKIIEINGADSAQLESLKGIGPTLASRIIRYRERLGGFYLLEQLKEVYGIDSALYEKLVPQVSLDVNLLRKIALNTAGLDEFRQHPYLSYRMASLIVNYRKQHGNYQELSDIKKIALMNEEIFSKIEAYLSLH
jgi:competence protein ComEA